MGVAKGGRAASSQGEEMSGTEVILREEGRETRGVEIGEISISVPYSFTVQHKILQSIWTFHAAQAESDPARETFDVTPCIVSQPE
mmetsp:Transcript_15670/g.35899  ORF Transcript_15670/g.35899 Transcript_15670/m.35899 type:complete len:86 (+) Transcript_15670:1572-1829(+)|eukprot:190222-Hanusia_phi.AAC.4